MPTIAGEGLPKVATIATLRGMVAFTALDDWQRQSKKNDAQTADLIGVKRSKFSRFRNGLQSMPIEDLLELERITGITPAQCAEFYADIVKQRTAGLKKNDTALAQSKAESEAA